MTPREPGGRADRPIILHLISSLHVGGAERMLVRLVAATGDRFDHRIVSMIAGGALAQDARAAGAEVVELGLSRSLSAVAGLGRLRRLVGTMRPTVLQAWMYHAHLAAVAALPLTGPRPALAWNVRHTLESLTDETLLTRAAILAGVPLAPFADGIVYNAERSAQRHAAIGYPSGKALVIPNGFDLDAFRPDTDAHAWLRAEHGLAPDTPIVGRVARNHPMKDHACLFGAFARVVEAVPAARLAVVGSGMVGDDPALAGLAAVAGVADKVLWLGPRRDIERLTAGFDVALSTSSRGEGFPNVMGEAMACGVPMVATDVGDAAAILDDPARIVPPGDAAGLAAIVVQLLQAGPDARAALGVRDRQRALARFTIAAVGDAYAALWARLVPPGAKAPGGGSLHST